MKIFWFLSCLIVTELFGFRTFACGGPNGAVQLELGSKLKIQAHMSQEFFVISQDPDLKIIESKFVRKPSDFYSNYYKTKKLKVVTQPQISLLRTEKLSNKFQLNFGKALLQNRDQGLSFTITENKKKTEFQIEFVQTKDGCSPPKIEKL